MALQLLISLYVWVLNCFLNSSTLGMRTRSFAKYYLTTIFYLLKTIHIFNLLWFPEITLSFTLCWNQASIVLKIFTVTLTGLEVPWNWHSAIADFLLRRHSATFYKNIRYCRGIMFFQALFGLRYCVGSTWLIIE